MDTTREPAHHGAPRPGAGRSPSRRCGVDGRLGTAPGASLEHYHILLLPQSGQVQPERPRGADPEVTPWCHVPGQKRVVRSGVAQVLFSIQALTQTVLLSQRKCLFSSSLSCGGHGIRSTPGVEIGSSRWIPRFGSRVRRKEGVFRGGARSGRRRSDRRTAVRGHGVHVAERDHSRRARVGARPWSWSSAGGSPDALAKAGRRPGGAQVEHPGRGQARHPDEGHDHHARRAVRRDGARLDLRAYPGRVSPAPGPRGRKLGRPKRSPGVSRLDGREDESRRFLELGVSTAIAKLTAVSRTTLYSFMNTHGRRAGSHAPAPWPGRDCTGQRRLAAQPVRPQDALRRVSATVTGSPPRSCAGSGTR